MQTNNATVQKYSRSLKLMGNHFTLTVVGENPDWAHEKIGLAIAEIQRIEQLLTTFSDDSQTNKINRNAGTEPVEVDREVFELIERSIAISKITQARLISATAASTKACGILTAR